MNANMYVYTNEALCCDFELENISLKPNESPLHDITVNEPRIEQIRM